MRTTTTKIFSLCLFLLGAAQLMGASCEEERVLDTASGGDETRRTALKLFFGQNVTDSIDDGQGDNTDWKEVRVRESGNMGVIISIDKTANLRGEITIHDGFGTLLERRDIKSSDNLYTFDRIPVDQGEYYVKVFVNRGASVYTAGATFDALPGANVQRPPIDNEVNSGNGGNKVRIGPGPRIDKDPKDPVEKEPVEKEPVEQEPVESDDNEFINLTGRIVRFVPLDDGGAQLTISGLGSDNGVASGAVGTIVGLGQKFRITRVQRRGAVAITKADAEQLEPYKSVVVRVKKP